MIKRKWKDGKEDEEIVTLEKKTKSFIKPSFLQKVLLTKYVHLLCKLRTCKLTNFQSSDWLAVLQFSLDDLLFVSNKLLFIYDFLFKERSDGGRRRRMKWNEMKLFVKSSKRENKWKVEFFNFFRKRETRTSVNGCAQPINCIF